MFCSFFNNLTTCPDLLNLLDDQANQFINWLDGKLNLLDDIDEPTNLSEYRGIVETVQPIISEPTQTTSALSVPYFVTFLDGEEMEISFPEVPEIELTTLLAPGQVLQLKIHPDLGVREICPLKTIDFDIVSLRQFLDEADLDYDQTLLKVRYVDRHQRQPASFEMIVNSTDQLN